MDLDAVLGRADVAADLGVDAPVFLVALAIGISPVAEKIRFHNFTLTHGGN